MSEREFQADFETGDEVLEGASTSRRPDAVSLDYLRAFTFGPVALQDTSEGVWPYRWYMRVDNAAGEVYIARENDAGDGWDPEALLFSFDAGVAPIDEADIAFNQNGDPVVVAERAGDLWIRFFDPTAGGGSGATVFTNFGEGRNPKCILDEPRIITISDVLVFYVSDTADGIVYREQADRYASENATPHSGADGVFVEEVAKDTDNRLQVVYSIRDAETGTYTLDRLVSALYPIEAETEGVDLGVSPLAATITKVLLRAFDQPTEGAELSLEPLSVSIASIQRFVDILGVDPGQTGTVGWTEPEGAELTVLPLALTIASIIKRVDILGVDPGTADTVGWTNPEGTEITLGPTVIDITEVIIRAFNQPIEGADMTLEPLTLTITTV